MGADGGAGVEEGPRPARALPVDGSRNHVAGREIAASVIADHERLASRVHQNRAFAPQGFGGQRRGVAGDVDGGGMELDEFRIADDRAGD